MSRFTVATLLFFFMTLPAFSQESDTMYTTRSDSIYRLDSGNLYLKDTVETKVREAKDPTRALMYALVLPGLGQAYNGKYWKMPIVWAALGTAGYAIVFNTNGYKGAVADYIANENDETKFYLDAWKRNMELSYIAAILVYGLQILDAYVDANMSTWDVNENLSMRVSPSIQPMLSPDNLSGISGGLTCSFKIKGR
jgi:hypothetical protein